MPRLSLGSNLSEVCHFMLLVVDNQEINGVSSDCQKMKSGVPQGAVVGPLLVF